MKPTPIELDVLQQKLSKILTYRETYEEVNDHILSALENEPENVCMGDAMNKIIRSDFGGVRKLQQLEKNIKRALVKETIKKYGVFLSSCLMFPNFIYTISLSLLFYYLTSHLQPNTVFWHMLYIIPVFVLGIIVMLRYFKAGYIFRDKKASAKDRIFGTISRFPLQLICLVFVINVKYKIDFSPLICSITFMVLFIHVLAVVKLYKDEFKTVLVN